MHKETIEIHGELVRESYEMGFPAWMGGHEHPITALKVAELANEKGAKNVLEIGYLSGATAIPLILGDKERRYTGYDSSFIEILSAEKGCLDRLNYHLLEHGAENFQFIQQNFPPEDGFSGDPFDFVFIDHEKNVYIEAFEWLLKTGSVTKDAWIVFHDIVGLAKDFWPQVVSSVAERDFGTTESLDDPTSDRHIPQCGIVKLTGGHSA